MPRPTSGLVKINFYLEPTVLQGYKWLAKAKGTTYSELLRTAALDFIVPAVKKQQDVIHALADTQEAADG